MSFDNVAMTSVGALSVMIAIVVGIQIITYMTPSLTDSSSEQTLNGFVNDVESVCSGTRTRVGSLTLSDGQSVSLSGNSIESDDETIEQVSCSIDEDSPTTSFESGSTEEYTIEADSDGEGNPTYKVFS